MALKIDLLVCGRLKRKDSLLHADVWMYSAAAQADLTPASFEAPTWVGLIEPIALSVAVATETPVSDGDRERWKRGWNLTAC